MADLRILDDETVHFRTEVEDESCKLPALCDMYKFLGDAQAIVYCSTSLKVGAVQASLKSFGIAVLVVQEEMILSDRESVFLQFRTRESCMLLSASPEILIGNVDFDCCIHFDIPQSIDQYRCRVDAHLLSDMPKLSITLQTRRDRSFRFGMTASNIGACITALPILPLNIGDCFAALPPASDVGSTGVDADVTSAPVCVVFPSGETFVIALPVADVCCRDLQRLLSEVRPIPALSRYVFLFEARVLHDADELPGKSISAAVATIELEEFLEGTHHFYVEVQTVLWKWDGLCDVYAMVTSEPNIYVIVYCSTPLTVVQLHARMASRGFPCLAIHHAMTDVEREIVLDRFFFGGECPMLISTTLDIAARDSGFVSLYIHYDVALNVDEYLRRFRCTDSCSRFKEVAITFVTRAEGMLTLEEIGDSLGIELADLRLSTDFIDLLAVEVVPPT